MSLTPLQQYQQDLTHPGFIADPKQAEAMCLLDDLFCNWQAQQSPWQRLKGFFDKQYLKGIYLWGNVGTGKTYLMDTFCECLPKNVKQRTHFHRFMNQVHSQLKEYQGEEDPLKQIAKLLSENVQIICFDEFMVKDIADAMILGRLLTAMFDCGLILVATSNVPIDQLYKDGLQRERFLSAIQLLQNHMTSLEVNNEKDYRMQQVESAGTYFYPLDEKVDANLFNSFQHFAGSEVLHGNQLEINGRELQAIRRSEGVVWVDFSKLCEQHRSASDYLALAQQFHTLVLSGVPTLTSHQEDAAARFIQLIDVFYDQQLRLVIAAASDISELYQGQKLKFEFQRTCSRLYEMQSKAYLEKATMHKYSPSIRI